MLTREHVEQFKRDGFLKGSRVLTAGQCDELCGEVERVLAKFRENFDAAEQPKPVVCRNISRDPANEVWQIVNIYHSSEPFRRLVFHPMIVEEIAQLSEASEIRIWHDQIQYKPSTTGGVLMWHQDAPYWPILKPMHQVTAWVALDDVDESNGCMSMVAGSHLWGNEIDFLQSLKGYTAMPAEFKGHAIVVKTCPVKRGEVHYHHSLTWHGSHANTSQRKRRAVALHYMPGETRYDASGNHVMKPLVTVADGEKLEGAAFPKVWPRA